MQGGVDYLIYYISVLPIPNQDVLNPIVFLVSGTPSEPNYVNTDARILDSEIKTSNRLFRISKTKTGIPKKSWTRRKRNLINVQ